MEFVAAVTRNVRTEYPRLQILTMTDSEGKVEVVHDLCRTVQTCLKRIRGHCRMRQLSPLPCCQRISIELIENHSDSSLLIAFR